LRDRLSSMRFAGLGLHQVVPDAKTIWLCREQLKQAGAIDGLFRRFDEVLASQSYLAMGRQIINASLIAAPRQKLTLEKATLHEDGAITLDSDAVDEVEVQCFEVDASGRVVLMAQVQSRAAAWPADCGWRSRQKGTEPRRCSGP